MNILNITNGSHAVDLMQAASIVGDKISWDDLLHEGPVPAGLSLSELSVIRSRYIIEQGWADELEVKNKFNQRDNFLINYANYDRVVLWFEHDLYDQLQLIQILSWFSQCPQVETELMLICTDQYLGRHKPNELFALQDTQKIVSPLQLETANQVWLALTANNPTRLNQMMKNDLAPLPFLKSALLRLAQEYPDSENGLPLTENYILQSLIDGELLLSQLFSAYQQLEKASFMGDLTFWSRLNQMANGRYPLIKYKINELIALPVNKKQLVSVTDYGKQCLLGERQWFADNSLVKCIGGCVVSGENYWVWESSSGLLKIF